MSGRHDNKGLVVSSKVVARKANSRELAKIQRGRWVLRSGRSVSPFGCRVTLTRRVHVSIGETCGFGRRIVAAEACGQLVGLWCMTAGQRTRRLGAARTLPIRRRACAGVRAQGNGCRRMMGARGCVLCARRASKHGHGRKPRIKETLGHDERGIVRKNAETC